MDLTFKNLAEFSIARVRNKNNLKKINILRQITYT